MQSCRGAADRSFAVFRRRDQDRCTLQFGVRNSVAPEAAEPVVHKKQAVSDQRGSPRAGAPSSCLSTGNAHALVWRAVEQSSSARLDAIPADAKAPTQELTISIGAKAPTLQFIAFGDNEAFLVHDDVHVLVVRTSDCAVLRQFGSAGSEDGQFGIIRGIAWGGDRLLVSDAHNNRIQTLDEFGNFALKWHVFRPDFLVVDSRKQVYVVVEFVMGGKILVRACSCVSFFVLVVIDVAIA